MMTDLLQLFLILQENQGGTVIQFQQRQEVLRGLVQELLRRGLYQELDQIKTQTKLKVRLCEYYSPPGMGRM